MADAALCVLRAACRGYRRSMAKSMTAANAVPHFLYMEEIEMGGMVKVRAAAAAEGQPLTHMPTMVKALSQALLAHPLLNGVVNDRLTHVRCSGEALSTSSAQPSWWGS